MVMTKCGGVVRACCCFEVGARVRGVVSSRRAISSPTRGRANDMTQALDANAASSIQFGRIEVTTKGN